MRFSICNWNFYLYILIWSEINEWIIGLILILLVCDKTTSKTSNDNVCRSVINVLQEKQEAQERDLAIMKDDLARLKRDLVAERELVRTLKTQTADSTWAIADVKRGQDQVGFINASLNLIYVYF